MLFKPYIMEKLIKSSLKQSLLCIIFCYPLFSTSQTKSSDIEYLRIAEIELSNDTLFLWQQIRPKLDRMDTTHGTYHKQALSNKEKNKFIKLVKKLDLLNIQSNDKQKTGYYPFKITYRANGQNQTISAYQSGMSKTESANFEEYLANVGETIDRKNANERFMLNQTDGEYQLRTPKKYKLLIGPSGWISYQKSNGTLTRNALPLLFVNGKEKEPNEIDNINPKKIKTIRVLKSSEADSLYGGKAKYGVILMTTK